MTSERGGGDSGEWFADSEGNLTSPDGLTPDTDEFGRDDPAALERERRRREREQQRKGGRMKAERKQRRRRAKEADPVEEPVAVAAAPPTRERPGRCRAAEGAARVDARAHGPPPRRQTTRRRPEPTVAAASPRSLWRSPASSSSGSWSPSSSPSRATGPARARSRSISPRARIPAQIADILDEQGVISSREPVRASPAPLGQEQRHPGRQLHARREHELRHRRSTGSRGRPRPPAGRPRSRSQRGCHATRSPPTSCPKACQAMSTCS